MACHARRAETLARPDHVLLRDIRRRRLLKDAARHKQQLKKRQHDSKCCLRLLPCCLVNYSDLTRPRSHSVHRKIQIALTTGSEINFTIQHGQNPGGFQNMHASTGRADRNKLTIKPAAFEFLAFLLKLLDFWPLQSLTFPRAPRNTLAKKILRAIFLSKGSVGH